MTQVAQQIPKFSFFYRIGIGMKREERKKQVWVVV